ncbi:MAG: hybrid sensor histidine kinase/response regulator [Hyphomicrobium sp.]|uniref:ATP-binding response regulator n=1 Tax=Hyphomicrobium sp. TaxID=82 RepID=UPI0039E69907
MNDEEDPSEQLPSRQSDLRRVVDKLRKINAALMKRVEHSMDQQASSFSLFQTAINQEAQIRRRTEELNLALTKLAHTNLELSKARDEAERANVFKTRFFTSVGHDLLQPLHAARLTLSELSDAQHEADNKRLALNISTALVSIEELLTSILDISKLEAGVFVPNIQSVILEAIFEQVANSLEPVARRKCLRFHWRKTDLAVRSDPLMLRRIVQNLLANAAHYTEAGGILLAARPRGDDVAIEVWDTGQGIPEQEQQRIFEEFQRGSASERLGSLGFGLGLAIVRRMADALGHRLELQSRVGHGSRFSVFAPSAAALAGARLPLGVSSNESNSFFARQVIVVDDDLTVLAAMQTLLSRWGADVRPARDLEDVGDILSDPTFSPAIVLADYHLDEGIFGIDIVRRIRRRLASDIPAILITADRTDAAAEAAMRSQCELLLKPIRPSELRALMKHLLG